MQQVCQYQDTFIARGAISATFVVGQVARGHRKGNSRDQKGLLKVPHRKHASPEHDPLSEGSNFAFESCVHLWCILCHLVDMTSDALETNTTVEG